METFAIWKDLTLVLHEKFVSTYFKFKKNKSKFKKKMLITYI